jgi:mannitol/fructose-specific phosphotransferase system IIA component (Ntr-type)
VRPTDGAALKFCCGNGILDPKCNGHESFLSESDVIVDMRAADKVQLLQDLATRAALGAPLDPALVSAEILKSEELGSTGLGSGVAVPTRELPG